jgi:tight adherence protein C
MLPKPWNGGWRAGAIIAAAIVVPDLLLVLRVRAYRRRIETEIPFWLDLHATLMEGGIGFDEALTRIVAESGHLRRAVFRELADVHRRSGLGNPRTTALKDMAARLNVEGLDAVVGAILQGEHMGVGIADTLRAQADMMRNKVWEDAQARAQKLPVKLIFPIAIGVLPSLFLVTIAPSVIRFLGFLSRRGL